MKKLALFAFTLLSAWAMTAKTITAVSYTHLTLPTTPYV